MTTERNARPFEEPSNEEPELTYHRPLVPTLFEGPQNHHCQPEFPQSHLDHCRWPLAAEAHKNDAQQAQPGDRQPKQQGGLTELAVDAIVN